METCSKWVSIQGGFEQWQLVTGNVVARVQHTGTNQHMENSPAQEGC